MKSLSCTAAILVFAFASSARAEELPEKPTLSKKDQYLASKARVAGEEIHNEQAAWRRQLDKRVGKPPKKVVNIYNKWTHETIALDMGSTTLPEQEVLNTFLRCHFTNEPTSMDPRLFPMLVKAASKFRSRRIEIVSGFRDPKYNLTLRKKGRQVARNSEHTLGHAIDFRLQGVSTERLHAFVRSLRLGGVGFYKHSRFVHMDVGRVRYWNGN